METISKEAHRIYAKESVRDVKSYALAAKPTKNLAKAGGKQKATRSRWESQENQIVGMELLARGGFAKNHLIANSFRFSYRLAMETKPETTVEQLEISCLRQDLSALSNSMQRQGQLVPSISTARATV